MGARLTKCWRNGARAQSSIPTSTAGQKTETAQPDLPRAQVAVETPIEPPQIQLPRSKNASSAYTPPMNRLVSFQGRNIKNSIGTISIGWNKNKAQRCQRSGTEVIGVTAFGLVGVRRFFLSGTTRRWNHDGG